MLDVIRTLQRKKQTRVFLIKWQGTKIPRGAILFGHEIGWTQNGVVTSTKSKIIGTYDRLEIKDAEFNQAMLVYVDGAVVADQLTS